MTSPQFNREFTVQHGACDQVSPLIRRVVCNNPGPFTFTGTGTYIVGDRQVAVIDPGPVDDAHYAALLTALDGCSVDHIIITHTHMDHSPLAARLKEATGAKTYGYGPHGSGTSSSSASGDLVLDSSGDQDFVPDVEVRHGDMIEGNGWNLEAVFTPGHTSNHMAFALKEENILFSGDHVMAWSTSVIAPPDGNMADYFASLDLVLERQEEVYWPTHGPSKENPKPFVRAFLTHRRMREEAIFNRIKSGDRDVMSMVQAIYKDVDPRLHRAAAMSTLAHLEHLVSQHRINCEGPVTLDGIYTIT